jgi:hypothetical protein
MNGCDGIVERRDSAFYKSFAIRMPPDLISEVRGGKICVVAM